jgi:glycosyltransferase involved in cell wall biosynthesis
MGTESLEYVVITPVRDEEKFIVDIYRAMTSQTIRPAEWIIVDDGSSDRTGSLIDGFAGEHSWIRAVHRPNRGFRKSGGGVVEAFNDGLKTLQCTDWNFLVKFDGDLIPEPDYFEKCFERFLQDERLGVGGGTIYHIIDGKESSEPCPRFHVRGATKIYRRQCWEAIGGFWQAPGWDTIDEVKAQMLGWTSETFSDIRLLHQRLTGTAESPWADAVKSGLARYVAGYHPLFMLASCASRFFRKPYVTGATALFVGFLKGYVNRVPQVRDPALIQFVREQQMRRLMGRKTVWKYN